MAAMAPKDEVELKEMVKFAVSYDGGPIAIRYPRGSSYPFRLNEGRGVREKTLELGKGELLREGKDVSILCVGYMVYVALEASAMLAQEGVDCEVINARFIKPLDLEVILKSISKTGKLVTVEEGVINGGFGSFVLESIIDKIPGGLIIKNIGLPDRFIAHGDRAILLDRCGLSAQKIKESILSIAKPGRNQGGRNLNYASNRD